MNHSLQIEFMNPYTIIVLLIFLIIVLLFLSVNDTVRDTVDKFFVNHKSFAVFIYVFLGLICYAIGYYFYTKEGLPRQLILRLGDLLIIGVLVGFITNHARFNAIFKNEHIGSLYSKEELKKRKDIYDIWLNVSEVVFKDRFSKIRKGLLEIINRYYFPQDEKGYYDKYMVEYHLEFIDEEKIYLQSKEYIQYFYVTDSKGKRNLEFSSWINKLNEDEQSKATIESIKVDGVEMYSKADLSESHDDDGKLKYTTKLELSGKEQYKIEIKGTKVMKFDDDHDVSFLARRITNGLNCKLHYSDDITAYCIKSGAVKSFQQQRMSGLISIDYNGLLLPQQGFVFVLGRKK